MAKLSKQTTTATTPSRIERLDTERKKIELELAKAQQAQDETEAPAEIKQLGEEIAGYEDALKVNARKRAKAAQAQSAEGRATTLKQLRESEVTIAADLEELKALTLKLESALLAAVPINAEIAKIREKLRKNIWATIRQACNGDPHLFLPTGSR